MPGFSDASAPSNLCEFLLYLPKYFSPVWSPINEIIRLKCKMAPIPNILFKDLFICKCSRRRDLPSAGLFPRWPQGPGPDQANARSLILISHKGVARTSTVWPLSLAFFRSQNRSTTAGLPSHPVWILALQAEAVHTVPRCWPQQKTSCLQLSPGKPACYREPPYKNSRGSRCCCVVDEATTTGAPCALV